MVACGTSQYGFQLQEDKQQHSEKIEAVEARLVRLSSFGPPLRPGPLSTTVGKQLNCVSFVETQCSCIPMLHMDFCACLAYKYTPTLSTLCASIAHPAPSSPLLLYHVLTQVLHMLSTPATACPYVSLSLQVQQYHQAVQATIQGQQDVARPLLLQLLDEPLLQPPAPHAAAASTSPAAAARSPSTGQRKQQQQAVVAQQSRVLQGMRPKVLLSLAPLLGYSRKALDVWAEALTHDQHNPKIWEEISIALAHLGHLQLAVQAADRALGLRPTDVGLHERLAVLLAALEVGLFPLLCCFYPLFVEIPL